MKRVIVLMAFIFLAAIGSGIYAQGTPAPAVTGDKDLRDTDIKRRSVEMERIERDAKKADKTSAERANKTDDKLAAKYEEIKADYEQMQLSQDAVLKAYQASGKIDYAQISKSAQGINKSATRLNSNLFPLIKAEKTEMKKEEEKGNKMENKPAAKSVRDLIVELDNTMGSFVTSPMFQNLRVIDAEVSKKAKLELEKIIELSELLSAEAQKMDGTAK